MLVLYNNQPTHTCLCYITTNIHAHVCARYRPARISVARSPTCTHAYTHVLCAKHTQQLRGHNTWLQTCMHTHHSIHSSSGSRVSVSVTQHDGVLTTHIPVCACAHSIPNANMSLHILPLTRCAVLPSRLCSYKNSRTPLSGCYLNGSMHALH